ncbi:MAG: 3-hydroxyacyl-CoA dehydrogenase [Cyanobacteria bacterium RYN_339]|nr:3-hydroxyacyl-CoA dehydrogenase [Cyanobacteria bacterium RYN_339]
MGPDAPRVEAQLVIAILGAGTMGAGIAQVALQHGYDVVLYDVAEPGLAKGRAGIEKQLARLVEKGKLDGDARDAALARFTTTTDLHALVAADLVIEAAPESLAVKQDLFRFLDEACRPDAVLASNTSSLSITAIAACARHPERVIGLHFFNPAPLMALVEVIAAQQSGAAALETGRQFALALGKTPVMCQDTPGFIVNRVARSFYGEALKLAGEGAPMPAIDACMRAGGFRMGPFELMDLIGIDVNFAVTQAVYGAFFGDSRFRPHPIQQRMVAAGRLGQKSGQGFYAYPAGPTPATPMPHGDPQRLVLVGAPADLATWASRLAHHDLILIDATHLPTGSLVPDLAGVLAGFEVTPGALAWLAERVPALMTTDLTRTAAAHAKLHRKPVCVVGHQDVAFAGEGLRPAVGGFYEVPDQLGLVFPRILAMLVNEAYFALGEGVASEADIDRALCLGANYPHGPLAWGSKLGLARVVALLDALRHTLGEERYRAAPLLRQRVETFQDAPAVVTA